MRAAYPLYIVALMLAAVILFGVESGGRALIGWGEFSFQPSEIMKDRARAGDCALLSVAAAEPGVMALCRAAPLAMVGLPVILALDQPDLGTAALFGIVGGGLLFLAGVSWLYFIAAFVGVIVVLPHVWASLRLPAGTDSHLHRP